MNSNRCHANDNKLHLAVKLPEILRKIATFLPNSDLLTCTLINTTWEAEVRHRLLTLHRLSLTPENIIDSDKIITTRGNHPTNIDLHQFPNLSSCADFIYKNAHRVKTLTIRFVFPDPTWLQYLHFVSQSFPNLTTLKLTLISPQSTIFDNSVPSLKLPPKPNSSFFKVKKLGIISYHVPGKSADQDALIASILPQFVSLFPNLVTLSCLEIGQLIVQNFLNCSPSMTCLALKYVALKDPMRLKVAHLTHLDLGFLGFTPASCLTAILKIISGTLRHLKFSQVRNTTPTLNSLRSPILVPIMPQLRVFELVQNQFRDREGYRDSPLRPDLILKFEAGGSKKRILYDVQFPALETVRISREIEKSYDDPDEEKMPEQDFFETSVSFLFEYFLHENNSQGLSVKRLDVPFPPGDRFRFVPGVKCECGGGRFCTCFEWQDSSEFWDRVVAIFPNLVRYAAMGGSWERARAAKVKQWVELGTELGFLKEVEGKLGEILD
ncbi:uncharacterized protein LOC118436667 [Folsomia candida]|uniref:uncharacterized protein LOC118436667 n=1 Tax=Folsomia candida TaxID=158441 RepID=UPI001604AFE7|nr:uncharacterized protein LOC118436667 [Folsomia candida]